MLRSLFLLLALLAAPNVRAASPVVLDWLPGDARAISHASSASRDTAAMEAILAPRFAVTLGSEFGLLALRGSSSTLRFGASAFFGLESRTRSKQLFPAPGGDSDLWRGQLGYEVAWSLDRLARPAFGQHGAIELAVGYYHESEHHTASNDPVSASTPPDHPELRGRPQVGNFLSLDFASRGQSGAWELILREQAKLFVNGGASVAEPFLAGAGSEAIVQFHQAIPGLTPFWSTDGEELLAHARAPVRSFRSLLGVSLPGAHGDVRIYASCDAGAGKGLRITQNETTIGAGLRYTPFTAAWP